MKMLDGNTAAERQHSASQARAEARHDAYGERVITDIIDDLFMGKKVAGLTLHDFCDDITSNEIGAVLICRGDDRADKLASLQTKVEGLIREWCDGAGADEVAERERQWQEDDEADAAESRAAVREPA